MTASATLENYTTLTDATPASAIWECARLRGSRLDGFGHAVQRWCPARRPALGRRSGAGRLSGCHHRWDCTWQLDVGHHSKWDWGRGSAAHFWRRLGCFATARLVDADADGRGPAWAVPERP